MKKNLAIFLFALYLFGATDAGQLLKLPLLLSHYIKHKQENPYTTFRSFVQIHYVDPQPFDADYKQDMQLPFKTIPNAFFRYTPSVPTNLQSLKPNSVFIQNKVRRASDETLLSSLNTRKIFQPPRL